MAEEIKKVQEEEKKPPMVEVPIPAVRWAAYTVIFMILLLPWLLDAPRALKWTSAAMVLAHFAGMLNGIKNDK